jgi:hypothetical protein
MALFGNGISDNQGTRLTQLGDVLTSKAANLVIFNVIWASCVFGRYEFIVVSLPLTLAYVSFLIAMKAVGLQQIAAVAAIGIGVDCALTVGGLFQFPDSAFFPLWLVVLWIGFSTTLPLSLNPIGRRKWLAALAGAIAGPFNYAVGERIGAVAFPQSLTATVAVLAAVWVLLLPLLFSCVADKEKKDYATV